MKQLRTALVSNTIHIDVAQIPQHVGQNIAQIALRAIQQDYQDAAIQADFRRRKTERAVKEGRTTNERRFAAEMDRRNSTGDGT